MKWIARLRARVQARQAVETVLVLPSALRLPIVPTGFGLAFFAVLLVMLLWVINHQLNLGYALIFLLAFVALFSAVFTASTLSALRLQCGEAEPVFAGQTVYFPIYTHNDSLRDKAAFSLRNDYFQTDCEGLAPQSSAEIRLPQPSSQRGYMDLQPLEIFTTMPLGLFVAWQWRKLSGRALIYPAPSGDLPLPYLADDSQGNQMRDGRGEDELSYLRPYQTGDALSRVAWKQSSRGQWLLKQFTGMGAERVILDYAQVSGDKETRIAQLTRWVLDAEAAGLFYALHLPNFQSEDARGTHHYHACLKALALL